MAKFFANLKAVIAVGVVLLIVLMVLFHRDVMDGNYWRSFFLFLHVLGGIMWIGLLYYFNFVQTPMMPKVPAELKPGVSKYIAPTALFWFRYGALWTLVTGLIVAGTPWAGRPPYVAEALTFQPQYRVIGTGMWLAIIMAANVWFVIWPNQKRVLGLVAADDASKAKSAALAGIASRTNTLLSIPMLYCMVMQAYLPV
jgi:uncharacterized membrane protein